MVDAPARVDPAPSSSASSDELSRRDLLARLGKAAAGATALALAGGAVRVALPRVRADGQAATCLGPASDFRMGTSTFLAEHELYVVHDLAGYAAVSSRCTHLGCAVRLAGRDFSCACHGARYDARGAVLSGPAKRALPWFALRVDGDGQLWVDKGRIVEAGVFAGGRARESAP